MPAKPDNIDNYKSYLLCIEFVQNELDPCWKIYHAPKIKTFIQKDALFRSIIALEAWAMQKNTFRGNKKDKVLDNLVEKNGQVSGSRIRGTLVSTWKKEERKKKLIAHGPSNKQYASKSWQVFNFQSLWSKSMAFLSSDVVLIRQ